MARKVSFKKPVLVLVLAAALVGGVSVQEKAGANKFTVTVDTAPLLKALIASDSDAKKNYFGVGAVLEFDLMGLNAGIRAGLGTASGDGIGGIGGDITHLDVLALWRFYPLAQLTKLYLSTEIGFSYEQFKLKSKPEGVSDPDPVVGLVYGLRAGWKQQFSKVFIDTSLGYGFSKMSEGPFGWHGWDAGIGFGFAL